MKYICRFMVISGIALLPLIASAQSVQSTASLRAQIQALLQQIAQIQQSSGAGGSATGVNGGACPNIGRSLKLASSGEDVKRLQSFLARDPSVYPEAKVTGYFGNATQLAVTRWQTKYNIVSSGSPSTTGYGMVGPRTAAAMALICATDGTTTAGSVGSSSNVTSVPVPDNTVSGYLQVTPFTGQAPLTVTVTATVNTLRSCNGAVYGLDFGDGSGIQQIVVPAGSGGNCQTVSQTFTHTYTTGSSYRMTLSSGTHHTYAQVMVSGGVPTASADSVASSVVSSSAPATVNLSGVINALASCTGGTYTLVYGDGQSSVLVYPSQSCSALPFSVAHQYAYGGSYVVQLFPGTSSGSPAASVAIVLSGNPAPSVSTSTSTSTSNGTFSIISLTANASPPHSVTAQFSVPFCSSYMFDWGDGSLPALSVSQSQGPCSSSSQVNASLNHPYAATGTYTVTLKDNGTQVRTPATATIVVQ